MTKQDAITVLSKLGTQVVEMTINDSNFIKKSAAWCLEYLESKKEIFEMYNTIELESNSFEFICAMNTLDADKENEFTPHYTKEQIEELESENFYAQLCKSHYKPLHHK